MRVVAACLLLVGSLTLGVLATAGYGQPRLSISPEQGPAGTVVTIVGDGFVPGDTVYLEVFPGTGSDHGTISLATMTVDESGRFSFALSVPPAGLENLARLGGPFTILAYPSSFGNRTTETVAAAPKAVFTLTAGAPPPSGLGALADRGESGQFGALLMLSLGAVLGVAAAIAALGARRAA